MALKDGENAKSGLFKGENMKVNILGTEYTVEIRKYNKTEFKNSLGWCNWQLKQIVVADVKTNDSWANEPEAAIEYKTKEILRHEIIHAFLYESGLHINSVSAYDHWALDEEMIDWFAIQSPKIFKAFQECDCI